MRHRVLSALALSAGLTLPSPVNAAPKPGTLVLAGNGSRHGDVTFTRAVSVRPLTLAMNGDTAGWSWKHCGRVRGFYVQPLGKDAAQGVGAVDVTDFASPNAPRMPLPLGIDPSTKLRQATFSLPAGRYRVHLFGEGNCEVRVPLSGLLGTLKPKLTAVTTMQFAVKPLSLTDSGFGSPSGITSFPLTIRPATYALAIAHATSETDGTDVGGNYSACIDNQPGPLCVGSADRPRSGQYVNDRFGPHGPAGIFHVVDFMAWYEPTALSAGSYTARVSVVKPQSTSVVGAMVAIDL